MYTRLLLLIGILCALLLGCAYRPETLSHASESTKDKTAEPDYSAVTGRCRAFPRPDGNYQVSITYILPWPLRGEGKVSHETISYVVRPENLATEPAGLYSSDAYRHRTVQDLHHCEVTVTEVDGELLLLGPNGESFRVVDPQSSDSSSRRPWKSTRTGNDPEALVRSAYPDCKVKLNSKGSSPNGRGLLYDVTHPGGQVTQVTCQWESDPWEENKPIPERTGRYRLWW